MRSRVVFVGQSLSILDWLFTRLDIEVCAVFVPKLAQKRSNEWFTRCAQRGAICQLEATPQDVAERMPPAIDIGICAHFDPLPRAVLNATRLGFINIHPAPLPEYSGRYPLIQLTLDAPRESGVSIHWMSERVDQGDLIAVERFAITPLDGPVELEIKAEHVACQLLSEYWDAIIDGYAPRTIQPQRPLMRTSRLIPCPTQARSGIELWRMIRAYGPYGGTGLHHAPTETVVRIIDARLSALEHQEMVSHQDLHHPPYFNIHNSQSLRLIPSIPLSPITDEVQTHTLKPSWALQITHYVIEPNTSKQSQPVSKLSWFDLNIGEHLTSLPVDLRLRLP